MKIHCDLSRICEVEDSVVEWYDSKYFQRQGDVASFDHLTPLFDIVSYQCAGVDGVICKIHLRAKKTGEINDPSIGINVVIKDQSTTSLVHEIKRVGFLIDRNLDL